MVTKPNNVKIENAKLLYRNFAGAQSKFNAAGNRNFCVVLDQRTAESLAQEGWNVKYRKPRDEGDEETPYIAVAVSYDNIPPKVVMISGSKRTILSHDTIEVLDWAEILTADLVVRPYLWSVGPNSGIKGYLKTMYIVVEPDEFEDKYSEPGES